MNDSENSRSEDTSTLSPLPGKFAGNIGDPILLTNVGLDGVAAGNARGGEMLQVWTRLAITSDDPAFHRIADSLAGVIRHHCNADRKLVNVENNSTILLIIRPDKTAELWMDTAAICLNILSRRDIPPGTAVFDSDIVDVIAMSFPMVNISADDKVVCLFRQGWRFGLYFDFNPKKSLSVGEFHRTLGSLYRNLKYRHIYDAVERPETFEKLIDAGWFPFAEIITTEFRQLAQACEAGFDLKDVEQKIVAAFDAKRLDRMLSRWLTKPHFLSRESILRSAIKNFASNDPVAVIKIVLTEIEGVLNAAYRAAHGTGASRKALIEFAVKSAERKSGSPYTLLLPIAFAHYLEVRTFAQFDPVIGNGNASSRHAVGHGEAAADTYTNVAALQALLTLDQFAFSI